MHNCYIDLSINILKQASTVTHNQYKHIAGQGHTIQQNIIPSDRSNIFERVGQVPSGRPKGGAHTCLKKHLRTLLAI